MRFYSRKAPRKKADILIEKISSGKCDDLTVSELKVAVDEVTDPEEIQRISWAILDIAINSSNTNATAYAIKSIMIFLPMSKEIENALERRLLMLLDDKSALSNKVLIAAIAEYLNVKTSEDLDIAKPFIPDLLSLLDEHYGNIAVNAYTILMDCATDRPKYFDSYSSNLIRQLGSINNSTRIQTSRLISVLGTISPEYYGEAERILSHLATFYPDADVKSAASEAYHSLTAANQIETPSVVDEVPIKEDPRTSSMAEIIRRKVADMDKAGPQNEDNDSKFISMASDIARNTDAGYAEDTATTSGKKKKKKGRIESHENDKEVMDMIIDDFSELAATIHMDNSDSEETAVSAGEITDTPASAKAEQLKPQQPEFIKARSSDRRLFGKLENAKPVKTARSQTYYDPEIENLEDMMTAEELELKEMVNKVKIDFTSSAGSILDAIGMGHLNPGSNSKMTSQDNTVTQPSNPLQEPVTITPVKEEKTKTSPGEEKTKTAQSEEKSKIEIKVENTSIPEPEIPPVKEAEKSPEIKADTIPAIKADTTPAIKADTTPVRTEPVKPLQLGFLKVIQKEPVEVEKADSTPVIESDSTPQKEAETAQSVEKKAPVTPKAPVMPTGVRLPSMKFKTIDNTKKPAHSIVSIKPHIKPLNRTPRDVSKMAQPKSQNPEEQQPSEIKVTPVKDTAADVKAQICPTCGASIADDLQYCKKCGFDVASQKYRCGKCGQINAIESNTCVRCGTKLLRPVINPNNQSPMRP